MQLSNDNFLMKANEQLNVILQSKDNINELKFENGNLKTNKNKNKTPKEQIKSKLTFDVINHLASQLTQSCQSKEELNSLTHKFAKLLTAENLNLVLVCQSDPLTQNAKLSNATAQIFKEIALRMGKIKWLSTSITVGGKIHPLLANVIQEKELSSELYLSYDLIMGRMISFFEQCTQFTSSKPREKKLTSKEIQECIKHPLLRKGIKPIFKNKSIPHYFQFLKAVNSYRSLERDEKLLPKDAFFEPGKLMIQRFLPNIELDEQDDLGLLAAKSEILDIDLKTANECRTLFESYYTRPSAFDKVEEKILDLTEKSFL